MKLSKVILAGVFSLGLFACSGSSEFLPSTEEASSSTVNTYMIVNLASSSSSRTIISNPEDGINPDENKVSSLTVVLLNSDNSIAAFLTNPTLITNSTGVSTQAFPMKTGSYRVLVVANPTADVNAMLKSANDYTSLKVKLSEISTFADNTKFLMTNAVNYIGDVTNIPTVTITDDNTEANPAHAASIKVDRMAAKIRMQSGMATNFSIAGLAIKKYDATSKTWSSITTNKVVMKSYALLNTYQKANLYQSWSETSATNNQLLVTPNSTSDYVAADFANGMDTYSTRTKDATSTYTSGYSELVDLTRSTASMTELTKVSYCLENNSKAVGSPLSTAVNSHVYYTKNQNTTTGVLFRTQLVDDNNKGVTFYSYNGKYYADLASILADHSNVFTTKAKTYTVAEVAAMTNPDIRTNFGVKVYEDGYIYYTHFIYDVNYTDPAAAADVTNNRYYAVLRNSIYDMNVTGIKKVGDDIPGGWDYVGTDPIDKKEAYMQIELTVSPWILDFYSTILK